jgi:hypothetical protein
MVTTDPEIADSHSDIDHHKRPSRRELEKENQQLRAMLKQQKDHSQRSSTGASTVQSVPSSTSLDRVLESEGTRDTLTRKASGKKEMPKKTQKDVPPVPPIPERVALRTLSNTTNQATNKNNTANLTVKSSPVDTGIASADALGPPRPVSTILEEDEDAMENNTPTPSPSPRNPKRLEPSSIEKMKAQGQIALQLKGVRREQWEWPEDVF